jgi:hypothetical protein
MEDMDLLAFSFAVAAVALGIVLLAYLVALARRPDEPAFPIPDTAAAALALRLGGDGRRLVWRFESGLVDASISVDVFSQRAVGDGATTEWRHDLMLAPLVLGPGQTAELPASGVGARHEAAVGWFVGPSPERNRDSQFVSVPTHGHRPPP